MKDLIKIALEGAFSNFKNISLMKVTDMDMRKDILTGNVKIEEKVDEKNMYWLWWMC